MVDVAIIDYGMGNLRSVQQAVHKVAPTARIAVTDDPKVVASAHRVIFPGQGAMPDCMRELRARGLRLAVLDAARNKPFLGICIGLQMLFQHSTEGDVPGLGLLEGEVIRFTSDLRDKRGNKLKVPHMGWNCVQRINNPPSIEGEVTAALSPSGAVEGSLQSSGEPTSVPLAGGKLDSGLFAEHPLWQDIAQNARFYFVHSYYVQPRDTTIVQATSDYPQPFVCAVARDNLFAVQFHPEKSARDGLQLLRNFVSWNPV